VYKETYAPTILQRRVNRLRKETGNPDLRSKMDSGLSPNQAFLRAIVRPSKMLLFSPIVLGLSVYNAVVYGYMYLLFTTISLVFEQSYGFSAGIVGLTFLGIGIGMLFGLVIFGALSDRILKAKAAQGEKKPEYRLPPMIPAAFLVPVGLFIYGWTAEKHVHWFVPIFGTSFVGFGVIATFMAIQTYLVDAFSRHAASAIAANTILRSLLGALLPLAGPSMYARLGLGWGNSLLGFIGIAFIPLPFFFSRYGERIRKSERFQIQL
jgi:MFS family permease